MKTRMVFLPLAVVGLLVVAHFPSPALAAAPAAQTRLTAPQLLPSSTVLYAELAQPKQFLATVLDHPIRSELEKKEPIQQALKAPGYRTFRAVVTLLEKQIGKDGRTVTETITQGGITLAIDAQTQGVVILARASDADLLHRTRDAFIDLARLDAANKGKPEPFPQSEYRGVEAFRAGDARFATIDEWFIITNKDDLGRQVVDNLLDLKDGETVTGTLGDDQQFLGARQAATGTPSAWAYVNLAFLRDAGAAKKLFAGKTDNPLAELLVGGLLDTIGNTAYATAALAVETDHLTLSFSVPHKHEWTSQSRSYYFGPRGRGTAPPLLNPAETVLTLATFRDLPAMWAASDDLYEEPVTAKIAQADSNLSNLFSGRDFGQEILGALGPEIRIVAARQQFNDTGQPVPDIKLPGAAAILTLKDPTIARQLKVSFQSFIGLLNFGQSQKGLPQFELNSEKLGKAQLISAVYLTDDVTENEAGEASAAEKPGIIQYNLTPALGIVDDHLILSTSKALAKELLDVAAKGAEVTKTNGTAVLNTHALADIRPLRDLLSDNRDHFIAQNMLEKGHNRQQAEREIDMFLDLLGYLKDASLSLLAESDKLELKLNVRLSKF